MKLTEQVALSLGGEQFAVQAFDSFLGFGEQLGVIGHGRGGYIMEEIEAMDTAEIIFAVRRETWEREPTMPPHPRSEQRIAELWAELEAARRPDWIRCLALAVADANQRAR